MSTVLYQGRLLKAAISGAKAHAEGKPLEANPFQPLSYDEAELYDAWEHGWKERDANTQEKKPHDS